MDTFLPDYLERLYALFFDPKKRLFVGYLMAAFLVAIVVSVLACREKPLGAFSRLFDRRIWLSRSARADYLMTLINQALMMGLLPRLLSKLVVATLIFEGLHLCFDGRLLVWQQGPGWAVAGLFTLVLFLLDDASKYLLHRALHKWPVLWAFHKVHHSAETLTPVTVLRTHPMEAVLFSLRATLVQAVTTAAFIYFLGPRAELATVLGANAILFVFHITGSNLRHSHVWLSYWSWLEHVLISPAQHQIHHSVDVRHHDRNFGAVLALWDWMGGSLCLAGPRQSLTFGTGEGHKRSPHTLTSLYLLPFREAFDALAKSVKKGLIKMPILRPFLSFNPRRSLMGAFALLILAATAMPALAQQKELNIYSHRQPFLIKPFIDAYEAETGTRINIVFASKGLAQRLQAEGARSPADVILTVDIARLSVYADKDLLATVDSDVLKANIPARLRDPENRWFAFSKRARVIVVSNEAKGTEAISRYEDLADPKWEGRICSRPGSHVYNRALVASVIHTSGVEGANAWAQGVMDNLARRPQGNDRAQVKAIYEGVCDIAIINNYYFGKLKHSDKPEQRDWANSVRLIFPNQGDRGTHVNISGGGIAKHSPNKEEAQRFLEFLTTKTAQDLYGAVNFEYPVNPNVAPSEELRSWGTFKEDEMPIAKISELAPEAQKVIDRVGW